jgi:lysophospholipase L1-like esterase
MSEQTAPASPRTVGTSAAYAGGAITAVGALGVGVLLGQALIARITIPGAEAPPPRCAGVYGDEFAGAPALRIAVIGDSTAAGYGVQTREETPGALLATWIAQAARRPVRLTCPAVVGSVSAWLEPQVEIALSSGVDLAVILVGANDVTSRAGDAAAARHLFDAVKLLRGAGAEVVVATCPDLGTIRPIPQPLRWLARYWSRRLAAAQAVATVEAGGRAVALGDLIGPDFYAAPDRMFGSDRYHPSVDGYRAAAAAIVPSALAALGLSADEPGPASRLRSLQAAAAAVANRPGSEVRAASAVQADGYAVRSLAGRRDAAGAIDEPTTVDHTEAEAA